jgi:hypothetical protein
LASPSQELEERVIRERKLMFICRGSHKNTFEGLRMRWILSFMQAEQTS